MIQCVICGAGLADVEDAVAAGWLPGFWIAEQEVGPVCNHCSVTYLTMAEDGEFEVKRQHRPLARSWLALQ